MILIDRRIGSSDLYQPLRARGLDVELTTLPSADVAWLGRGPGETPFPVGVEIKRVADLLSSITSGRLSGHQLPKLIHEYRRVVLLIEGRYRPGAEGVLETRQGAAWAPHSTGRRVWTWAEVEHYLMTLEHRAGVTLRRTFDRAETVVQIAALYSWWTSKAWDEHRAHVALHQPFADSGLLYAPSLKRRIAAELPGVGVGKSAAVADHFPTVRAMVEADAKEWQQIDGIGKTMAKRITDALG